MPDQPAAVRRWHAVVTSKDPALLDDLLADDVVFRSPAVFAPQEGKVLTATYLSAAPTGTLSSLFQPAVVGVGVGDVAAGDVGPAGAVAAGLVSASAVVVTGPAELPFSQADQDSCQ
jgi:hypothetical protein